MAPLTPASILIVEDERIVAMDLQQTLSGFGYDAFGIASSCEEALAKASEKGPDLVLMDIRIKGDVDGIGAAELIRTQFDIPIVYITAHADEATIARAKATEPFGYLLKPVKPDELRSAIEVSLHKHKMEKQLRERERWVSTTLRSIGDAVIATDVEGRVRFMNVVAEKLTGWTSEEATGRPSTEILQIVNASTREPVLNPILRALQEKTIVGLANDTTLIRRNGGEAPIDDSASPIIDDKVQVIGAVLVFRDVTEKKQLQSNLILSDRMVSVGLLASGVAHEINNPLASVIANLDLVLMRLSDHEMSSEPFAEIADATQEISDAREAAERIRNITSDLRTFSRSDDDKKGLVEIRRVLESTLRMAWNEIRHRAHLIKDYGKTPVILGNESRLGQVFLNVIVNAAQAIQEGCIEDNQIRISTSTDDRGHALIQISDSGAGISPEAQARLFQPFFTTKPVGSGTGLGLMLSRRILTDHGGTISLTSTPGQGTVVRISLPPAPIGHLPEPLPRYADALPGVKSGRVLVIDDDEQLGVVMKRTLSPPHEVTVLSNAGAAVERIMAGERFDVILCDVMMAQMTGIDFFARLLLNVPDQAQRIVFVTGGAFTPRSRSFLDDVPNQRIHKPFDIRQLRALVDDRIGRLK
jgi:two-component system cell cycle sensor histidine kinase/response regulator CckA